MQKVTAVATTIGFALAAVALGLGATWWWLPMLFSLGAVGGTVFYGAYQRTRLKRSQPQPDEYEDEEPSEQPPTDLRVRFDDDEGAMHMGFTMDPQNFAKTGKFFDVMAYLHRQQLVHLVEEAQKFYNSLLASKKVQPVKAAELTIRFIEALGKDPVRETQPYTPPPKPKRKKKSRSVLAKRSVREHGLYNREGGI